MAVELTGSTLTLDEVVGVARRGERVELSAAATDAMRKSRSVVESVVRSGTPTYGVTTGVGMRRSARVTADNAVAFNRSAIRGHLVGLGPPAPDEVVRAALLCQANALAAAYQGVRPEVARSYVDALNGGPLPRVSSLGTVGEADLAQNADLAHGVLRDVELEAGEAVALLANNAYSTGQGALAIADARTWLEWCDAASALSFEAFRANVSVLHLQVAVARPYPGLAATLERLRLLLDGSSLLEPGAARFLQDPLTFRCVPQLHGAARDALGFVEDQLAIELNAHQGNPLIVADEERLVSVGNFDAQPLAAALDFLRIALAPLVAASAERALKLLSPPFSGLTEGLVVSEGSWQDGLSELGVAAQALAAEARLLAHPVSFELVSTLQESGVEDRATQASLAGRRVSEMLDLVARVSAIELTVAAQACDLRGAPALGTGTASTYATVRGVLPFLERPDQMPLPLEELAALVRTTDAPA